MNNPDLWRTILAKVPGGIIAGGAVRDYLLGVEAKDIDVFVPLSWNSPTGFAEWFSHPDAEEYEMTDHVGFVMQQKIEGVTVDLIGISLEPFTGVVLINTFDFGICRSWFDGDQIHDTFEAMHDREKGRVTVMLDSRPERLLQRFLRFNARHGGEWSLFKDGSPYAPIIIEDQTEIPF